MSIMNKILALIFTLLTVRSVLADVVINDTTFPDDVFRTWVLAQSYGQDGVLTEDEIAGVSKIYLSTKKIQNLKGLECFTELTELDIELAQITKIDISKLTKLTHLECIWTRISELDISMNTELTELFCGYNLLIMLDVSNNTKLLDFRCPGNNLSTLSVAKNTALEILYCPDNQITELDVSKNLELKKLVCSNNQLSKLELKSLSKLESLNCVQNRLERITVSDCLKLEEIDCFNNQISCEAMDEFIEGLPVVPNGWGHLCIVDPENEQNVMTKAQVAAVKAKGWHPRYKYGSFGTPGYTDYEGTDDPTGITSPLRETEEEAIFDLQGRMINKPQKGIYIKNGKKILAK